MQKRILTREDVENIVVGASVLGGGGGGSIEMSLAMGYKALELGEPTLASVDHFNDDETFVVVSSVGAITDGCAIMPSHYVRSVELLRDALDSKIAGFIASETGPFNIINGWIQSALTGIPVVDAPADGRAHPTGRMGMMGLTLDPAHTSVHAAVGGSGKDNNYCELLVRGESSLCASLVREASIKAGGMVAVAREPVTNSFVKSYGCPGAMQQAISLGKALINAKKRSVDYAIETIKDLLHPEQVISGKIVEAEIGVTNGIDSGEICIASDMGELLIKFADAFMTLECGGKRIATFPDLILMLSKETALPVSGVEVCSGMDAELLVVKKESGTVKLGAAYNDPNVFTDIELLIERDLHSYM